MISWPDTLPCPVRRGFGASRQDARSQINAQTGPALRRRRFSSAARLVTFTLVLDPDQALRFDHFYAVTLKEGTQPFRMADYDRDGRPLMTTGGQILLASENTPLLVARQRIWVFGSETPVQGPLIGHLRDLSFVLMEMP